MPTYEMLVAAQMRQWPDSKIVPRSEVLEWFEGLDAQDTEVLAMSLAMTVQYDTGVFYECGRQPDGSYKWKGFRYGISGECYLSNFPENLG